MKKLEVFDPPMCCSSGVCGPEVDPVLPRFAADLQWLAGQGVSVERYNLSQQPQAFVANPLVKAALREAAANTVMSPERVAVAGVAVESASSSSSLLQAAKITGKRSTSIVRIRTYLRRGICDLL